MEDLNFTKSPIISVILPVYNQEKYIAETIESVLGQTFTDFEFLIMDDGSTDSSAEIIVEYANKDNRIITFFEPNQGKCISTNYLVNKAKGKWCAFLDADDLMLSDRLEKQLKYHQSYPKLSASSSHCYFIDEESKIFGRQVYPFLRTLEESIEVRNEKKTIMCSFPALMVLKEAYQNVGGLRKEFWPSEDVDFFHRLIDNGNNIVIIQDFLMKYRIHQSSVTRRNPLRMMESVQYTLHCMQLRRENKKEISRKEHDRNLKNIPLLEKMNKLRYDYAQLFAKEASFAWMKKKFLLFIGLAITASFLSPPYSIALIKNRINKNNKSNNLLAHN